MSDRHPGPWMACEYLVGKLSGPDERWEHYVADVDGHGISVGEIVEEHNAIVAERDDLKAKRKLAYEANARLEQRILGLEQNRDDLRAKLKQAVVACVDADPYCSCPGRIPMSHERSCPTRLADIIMSANPGIAAEIERERDAGKETAARDSRTDLCRGMDEHLRKEVRGG